jgi:hypothetical protein
VNELELFVQWMGPTLNKIYAGVHWATRRRTAEAGHLAVLAALGSRRPRISPPVRLEFLPVVSKGRRYDASNYAYTTKIIEDGLVRAGILSGDEHDRVRRIVIDSPIKGEETGVRVRVVAL